MTQPPQLPKKFCVSGKKYRVLGLAGSGGYAQVFKVEDANEKIYAVKKYVKMKAVSIQSAHTEILDEFKALRLKPTIVKILKHLISTTRQKMKNYQHENIIKLIDYEFKKVSLLSKNYVLTIVMEYCHNDLVGEVKRVMHKNESFPEKRILLILVDVLAALSYLHSNDIIHRDVKLDNVLVRPDSSCVLCDFGSCATSPILLNTASYEKAAKDVSNLTTSAYRSPEMLQLFIHKQIDIKSDIWTIGCMIHVMAFYKPPFGENKNYMINAKLSLPIHSMPYSKELIYIMVLCFRCAPESRPDTFQLGTLVSALLQNDVKNASELTSKILNHPQIPSQSLQFPPGLSMCWFEKLNEIPEKFVPSHRRANSALPILFKNLSIKAHDETNQTLHTLPETDNQQEVNGTPKPSNVNMGNSNTNISKSQASISDLPYNKNILKNTEFKIPSNKRISSLFGKHKKSNTTKRPINNRALLHTMSLATDNFRANEGDSAAKSTEDDTKLLFTYPIQRKSTMNEETRVEVFETCVTFCERFANNYEEACKNIKEILDKRFGPAWHVVIGKSYGFEVDSEMNTTFQMFFGGNLAITIWKCS